MWAIQTADWLLPLGVAAVPATASVIAAVLAARSAKASRISEIEAARLRDLENRLADKRYAVYQPMIDMLGQLLLPGGAARVSQDEAAVVEKISEFATWLSIFGSDDAVRAFHNFMQGAYHDAPPEITLRLYSELVLAARRDMGDRGTALTQRELLGMRITDLYDIEDNRVAASLPFTELCERHDWVPPWLR